MKVKKISHVAVAVSNIDDALPKLAQVLGLVPTHRELVASQKTEAALLPIGESAIELIEPKGNEGLAKFNEKRGPGLHHLAVECTETLLELFLSDSAKAEQTRLELACTAGKAVPKHPLERPRCVHQSSFRTLEAGGQRFKGRRSDFCARPDEGRVGRERVSLSESNSYPCPRTVDGQTRSVASKMGPCVDLTQLRHAVKAGAFLGDERCQTLPEATYGRGSFDGPITQKKAS